MWKSTTAVIYVTGKGNPEKQIQTWPGFTRSNSWNTLTTKLTSQLEIFYLMSSLYSAPEDTKANFLNLNCRSDLTSKRLSQSRTQLTLGFKPMTLIAVQSSNQLVHQATWNLSQAWGFWGFHVIFLYNCKVGYLPLFLRTILNLVQDRCKLMFLRLIIAGESCGWSRDEPKAD